MGGFTITFIKRPVLATVVGLVILILGLSAVGGLNVRQYPETTSATIMISTPYPGANANLVRGFVTQPLEAAISSVEGIEYLQSTSTQGMSSIEAQLVLNYSANEAVAQILTKINQVRNQLPAQSENSVVIIRQSGSTASLYLGFTSERLARNQITDYLNRVVRPRLESVQGVQRANLFGQTIAMRIWLDPDRMAASNVTAIQVQEALAANNYQAAVGRAQGPAQSINLTATTGLETAEQFENLVVRQDGAAAIRIRDVGTVALGAENYDVSVVFNGKPAVFIAIEAAPTANVLTVVGQVRALWPDIQAQMPRAIKGQIVQDTTVFIRASIDEVTSSIFQTVLIVAAVLYLFLGSLRAALVPTVAMVLSIIGTFFLMQLLGFSINLLTLLALIMAVGSLVDDGIVISESVARYTEQGASSFDAAVRTARELASSILAMNIVVLAMFAPVASVGGLTGSLMVEFAFTTAAETMISAIVALTLSPMMASKLITQQTEKRGLARWVDVGFGNVSNAYAAVLRHTLDVRWVIMGLGACVIASCYFLYNASDSELAPVEDQGAIIVQATGSPNFSPVRMSEWTSQLEAGLQSFDATENSFIIAGVGASGVEDVSGAFGVLSMKDWSQREISQMSLLPQVQQRVAGIAGLQTVVFPPPTLPGTESGPPIQYVISSTEEPRAILENPQVLLDRARRSGLFSYIESDLKFDQLQVELRIDRAKAADLGIDMRQLGSELSVMLSDSHVNFFAMQDRSYRVVPQVDAAFRLTPEALGQYRIRTSTGELIPISTVASLEPVVQPRQLRAFNQLNAATLSGTPAPGVSTGAAIDFLRATGEEVLPQGYVIDWVGESRQLVQEGSGLIVAFGLGVIMIFLVLAAQYESFRDPLIMLISIPMAIAGALLFAALGVVTINIYTQIGLLALAGSIVRHGILLVEFANTLQEEEGLERRAAIEKSASMRLRSILMTTIATVVGMFPLLFASGPGAESRFAISFVTGVGLAIGTVFTLFVVPAFYTVIAKKRVRQDEERSGTETAPQKA